MTNKVIHPLDLQLRVQITKEKLTKLHSSRDSSYQRVSFYYVNQNLLKADWLQRWNVFLLVYQCIDRGKGGRLRIRSFARELTPPPPRFNRPHSLGRGGHPPVGGVEGAALMTKDLHPPVLHSQTSED
eukprot:TRINITY_DN39088_c0_g1_i11.p4 TRINITY_DN39088_c0_g1~~TRINITY_DN39088_c0_g1_i11.p4  ORF type:complete len:128 (+),score=3.15 TRINITY_DN39088_c0_g1_i11:656-1039(+)